MTELAALNVRITGDAADLKAAVAAANGDLAKLAAAAQAAGLKVSGLSPKFTGVAGAGAGMSNSLRGISQQLSQVGQQTMATGNFAQALAIQLPDIGLAFGAVGAAAGLLAGIALPMLINAFGDVSEKAEAFDKAMKELVESTAEYQRIAAGFKMGVDVEEVLIIQRINELLEKQVELRKRVYETSGGLRSKPQLDALEEELAALQAQVAAYRAARDEAEKLRARNELAAEQAEKIRDAINAINGSVAKVTVQFQAQFSGFTGAAAEWAGKIGDTMQTIAEGGSPMFSSPKPRAAPAMIDESAIPSPAGGGGGGANPIVAELEALQQALMGQEQAQIDSYMRQQDTLQSALAQRLITQQEYNALMEEAQKQHQEAMSAIDVYKYGTSLQQAEAFFGDMASALQGGNEKMQRIARAFGAAEALINAWRAYSQVLADPSLPFIAKFAAAAKVLAAGMSAVNAIKGGGGGGRSQAGTTTTQQAVAPSPLDVRLTGIGANDLFSGAQIGNLLDRLSAEAGDRGYRIMVAA